MAKELQLPDELATPAEIELWKHELVPGVNVPRNASRGFHLSPGPAACRLWDVVAGRVKESLDISNEESEDETLSR